MDQPPHAGAHCWRSRTYVLALALAAPLGCTQELAQPVLTSEAVAASNSLRAPAPADPNARQARVAMPERRWGVNEGGVKRPLTSVKEVLAAQAKSLNDHPEGLQRAQLQAALDAQMGDLARCFDKVDATSVGVYFEADPGGGARAIQVRGAPAPAQACVTNLIAGLQLPQFKGDPVPVDFPISVRQRVETVSRAAEPAGAEQPRTFVNP